MEKIKNLATGQVKEENIEPIKAKQESAIFKDAERQAINEQECLGLETDKIEKEPDNEKKKLKKSMCIALVAFTFFAAAGTFEKARAGTFEDRVNNSASQSAGSVINRGTIEAGDAFLNFIFRGGKSQSEVIQNRNKQEYLERDKQNQEASREREYNISEQQILKRALDNIDSLNIPPEEKVKRQQDILNSLKNK